MDRVLDRYRRLSSLPAFKRCSRGDKDATGARARMGAEAGTGVRERTRSPGADGVKIGAGRYSAGLRPGEEPGDGSGLVTGHGRSASASAAPSRPCNSAMRACRQLPEGSPSVYSSTWS